MSTLLAPSAPTPTPASAAGAPGDPGAAPPDGEFASALEAAGQGPPGNETKQPNTRTATAEGDQAGSDSSSQTQTQDGTTAQPPLDAALLVTTSAVQALPAATKNETSAETDGRSTSARAKKGAGAGTDPTVTPAATVTAPPVDAGTTPVVATIPGTPAPLEAPTVPAPATAPASAPLAAPSPTLPTVTNSGTPPDPASSPTSSGAPAPTLASDAPAAPDQTTNASAQAPATTSTLPAPSPTPSAADPTAPQPGQELADPAPAVARTWFGPQPVPGPATEATPATTADPNSQGTPATPATPAEPVAMPAAPSTTPTGAVVPQPAAPPSTAAPTTSQPADSAPAPVAAAAPGATAVTPSNTDGDTRRPRDEAGAAEQPARLAPAADQAQPTQAVPMQVSTSVKDVAAPTPTSSGPQWQPTPVRLADLAQAAQTAIAISARNGDGNARITMHPAELGSVEIRLHYGADGVTASIRTDSAAATQTLAQAAPDLRRALEAQGLTLLGFDVRDRNERQPNGGTSDGRRRTSSGTGETGEIDEIAGIPLDPSHLPAPGSQVDVLA